MDPTAAGTGYSRGSNSQHYCQACVSGSAGRPLPIEPSPDNEGAVVECLEDPDNTAELLHQARRRVAELENTTSRQDEFLAMLGHELRNPLASILNGIHLLSHQKQDAPASRKMQAMIERQVQLMTRLADDLLDVSRITKGRLRLQRERIDLREVLSNAVHTLESDIGRRNHRLTVSLPDTPMWLQADPGRLEQVFVNLLANAAKYTDTGGELRVGGGACRTIRPSSAFATPGSVSHRRLSRAYSIFSGRRMQQCRALDQGLASGLRWYAAWSNPTGAWSRRKAPDSAREASSPFTCRWRVEVVAALSAGECVSGTAK